MDWNKEYQGLKEGMGWFKPKIGLNKIKILSDGEEYMSEYDDKDIKKVKFDIDVDGKKYIWGVVKGSTGVSLYGQLALIGNNLGTLKGQTLSVMVMGEGKDTRYMIQEAIPLMAPKEEKVR